MVDIEMGVFHVFWILSVLFATTDCSPERGPRMRILAKQMQPETMMLPSNATSIREDITDNFSCENKTYGYYADVDNECQIFHVCLPVTYADGKNQTFRWSFICPESTVFNQENFVCIREEDMNIKCEDSADYYGLNDNFGNKNDLEEEEVTDLNGEQDQMEADTKPMDGNGVDSESDNNDAQEMDKNNDNAQEMDKNNDNAQEMDKNNDEAKEMDVNKNAEDDMQKIDVDNRRKRPAGNKRRKQNDRRQN